MAENRSCAYCGKGKCGCHYRAGRKGAWDITGWNTSAQTTMGEMRKMLQTAFAATPDDKPGAWSFSFTAFDPKKVSGPVRPEGDGETK